MDSTLIANINDARSKSMFLNSQKQLVDDYYSNYNSYLYQAEQVSNAYMSMKQRVPMVLEYYQTPEELYTIEMYINPNELSFSHQKLIGKTVTRGGIFFHHYGEDAPTLNISGHTGLSGMAGIEQLERIFNYSGTLLRYQDVGINKINNGVATPRDILSYTGTFDFTGSTSGVVSDATTAYDKIVSTNATVNEIEITIEDLKQQINNEMTKKNTPANQIASAKGIIRAIETLKTTIGAFDDRTDYNEIMTQTNDELDKRAGNDESKILFTLQEIYRVASWRYQCVVAKNGNRIIDDDYRQSYVFQIAWQIYMNRMEEQKLYDATQNIDKYQAVADTVTDMSNVASIATSLTKSIASSLGMSTGTSTSTSNSSNTTASKTMTSTNALTGLQDNTQFTVDTSSIVPQNVSMCDEYTCIRECWLYSQPVMLDEYKVKQLVANARFTAVCGTFGNGNWIQHINGGYAPLTLTDTNVVIAKAEIPDWAKDIVSENGVTTGVALYPKGIFTYTEIKEISKNGTNEKALAYKHITGNEYAYVDAFEGNPQKGENVNFFKLEHANCYRYRVIRDDVFIYAEPNENSGQKFPNQPYCYNNALFTAITIQGNWAEWINGGWIKIQNADGSYNVEVVIEDNTATYPISGDGYGMLTSNNNITLQVQGLAQDCTTELQKYIRDVRVWAKNSVIKRFEIESGLADIMDELTDEWLPRLIFIYFEDRVFLGHFADFKYSRKAETEDITYNMTFIIHRIISVTSIDPDRFEQNAQLNNDESSDWDDYQDNLDFLASEYAKGNDLPLKVEILRTRCKFHIEQQIANYTGIPMTQERYDSLHGHAVRLRALSIYNGVQQITEDTPIFGNTYFPYDYFLCFMKIQYQQQFEDFTFPAITGKIPTAEQAQKTLELTTKINGDPVTLDMIRTSYFIPKYDEIIELELQRTLDVWDKDKVKPDVYTKERKADIVAHAGNILTSIGARFKNNTDYQMLMNHWLYEYNLEHSTSYNPYNKTVSNTTNTVTSSSPFETILERLMLTMDSAMKQYIKENSDNILQSLKINNIATTLVEVSDFIFMRMIADNQMATSLSNTPTADISNIIQEDEYTQEYQMKEDDGIDYGEFISKTKSITAKNTITLKLYNIREIKSDNKNVDLEILYKTGAFTIQVQNAVGKYGFDYKQVVITPMEKDTKNDIFLQLYDLANQKVQENRIKIIT